MVHSDRTRPVSSGSLFTRMRIMKRPCNAQVALWASLSVGRVLVERTTRREVAIFYRFMGASSRLLVFQVETCRAWERVVTASSPLITVQRVSSPTIMATVPAMVSRFSAMPSRTADLDETWMFLNRGVDHIMIHLNEGLSFPDYTSLYTTVYNYCTSTRMQGRTDGNRSMSLV